MYKNIYKNKKVLVTGHTGFKGAWLTSWLLKLGANVVGVSKDIPTSPSMFEELALTKKRLKRYYDVFDDVDVIIGNHSRLIMRKAQTGGVPREWIREYNDVLGVPNWRFHTELEIDGVLYAHGEGGTARGKCKNDLQSVVQGHLHTQLYVDYIVGRKNRVFGMQVGCGIDHEQYAFGYAKAGKKPAIGCGVVIGGKEAIAVPMILENYGKTSKYK